MSLFSPFSALRIQLRINVSVFWPFFKPCLLPSLCLSGLIFCSSFPRHFFPASLFSNFNASPTTLRRYPPIPSKLNSNLIEIQSPIIPLWLLGEPAESLEASEAAGRPGGGRILQSGPVYVNRESGDRQPVRRRGVRSWREPSAAHSQPPHWVLDGD